MIVQYLDRPANVTFIFNDRIALKAAWFQSVLKQTNRQKTLKKEV